MTTRNYTDQELVHLWRCNDYGHQQRPGGCWTSSHIARDLIVTEAATHGENCPCWRHQILQLTDEHGTYTGLKDDSPEGRLHIVDLEIEAAQGDLDAAVKIAEEAASRAAAYRLRVDHWTEKRAELEDRSL